MTDMVARRPEASLWLELEPRCNLRCAFCYNYWKDGRSPAPKSVPVQALLTGLERLLADIDCTKAAMSGGEPLLYPDLDMVLEFFAERGIPTILTTNALLLSESRLSVLMARGLGSLQVPLHSAIPEIHDGLAGGASWHASLRGIALGKRMSIPVTPVFVATSRNVHHLPLVVELASLLGLHRVIANRFTPAGLGELNREALWLEEAAFVKALRAANVVAQREGSIVELGVPVALSRELIDELGNVVATSCPIGMPQPQYTVDATGNLKECSQSSVTLGNTLTDTYASMRSRSAGALDTGEDGVQPCRYCTSGGPASITPVVLKRRATPARPVPARPVAGSALA